MTDTIHIQKDTLTGDIYIGRLNTENKWTGFGQVSFNDGRKMQGNFKEGKLNGLGLLIKPDGSAEFGKFKEGEKLKESKDDETMYIYDDMYNEFKDVCNEQGIRYFKWIEGEDEAEGIESESGLPEEEEDVEGIDIEDCEEVTANPQQKIETDNVELNPPADFYVPLEKPEEEENKGKERFGFSSMFEGKKGEEGILPGREEDEIEDKEEENSLSEIEKEEENPPIEKNYIGDKVEIKINKVEPKKSTRRRKKKRSTKSKKNGSLSPTKYDEFFLGKLPKSQTMRTLTPAKRILSTGEVITPVLDNVNKREAKSYKFKPSNSINYLDPNTPAKIPLDEYLDILSRENHILNYYKSYLERNPRLARRFLKNFKGISTMRGLKGEDAILGGLDIGFTAKDLEDLKRKYGLAALGELEKLGWGKRDLDDWNRRYGKKEPIDENLRKKIWAFNTNYKDLYDKILKGKYSDRCKSLEKKAKKILELGEKNKLLREELENNLDGKNPNNKKKRLRVQFMKKTPNSKEKKDPKKDFTYFNRKYFSGPTPLKEDQENPNTFKNSGKKLTPYPKGKDYSKYLEYAYPNTKPQDNNKTGAFDPNSSTKASKNREIDPIEFFLSKSPYDDNYNSGYPMTQRTPNTDQKPSDEKNNRKRDRDKIGTSSVDRKIYSPYLYHPADYFHKKGKQNKRNNKKYNYSETKEKFNLMPKKGILSKFNASKTGIVNLSPSRLKRMEKEEWVGDGPWYPGGDTLEYHNSRVENWKHASPERVKKFKVY